MALGSIREKLTCEGVDAFLVTHLVNVRYLSGFTGSFAAVVISPSEALFVTDARYEVQAEEEVGPPFTRLTLKPGQRLSQLIIEGGWRSIAVEDTITLAQYNRIKGSLSDVQLRTWSGVVEGFRRFKTPEEVLKIKKAVELAWKAFREVKGKVCPGVIERDLALELEFTMRKRGAEAGAFDFIVASGPRSALPHGAASSKEIHGGDLVVFDFGARWEGYHSDITRTLKVGTWEKWEKEIYTLVLEAQGAALEALKPGIKAQEVDAIARRVIEKGGYGAYFGHGLGHGVGLEVHEAPSLSPVSEDTLEIGTIFTIEPGIYIPNKGGVRIEDMVYLSPEGPKILTEEVEKEI